jgi:hypothetical protein
VRADRAGCPLRIRVAGKRRQLAVGDDLTPRNASERLDDRALKGRVAVEVELDVAKRVSLAGEMRRDSLGERVM